MSALASDPAAAGAPRSRVLEALAARPDACVLRDGGGPIRARELLERCAQIGAVLADAPGACVGVRLDNGPDWVACDLALLATGRVCVPLPQFFSPEQSLHVARSAGLQTWLTDSAAPPLGAGADSWTRRELGRGLWQWTERGARPAALLPPRTAKITFTSGTTGRPRGVCLSQQTLEQVASSLAELAGELGLRRHLCALPLSLLLENVAGLYAPLLAGIPAAVLPLAQLGWRGSSALELPRLLAALERERPDSLILVPELLHGLVRARECGAPPLRSLRFVAVGGGRVSPGLLERAAAVGLPVYEGYGLSECASVVALSRPGRSRSGWVGQALPHARFEIAGDGEVIVHGPCMEGYLGEPPHAPAGRWATGDLGRLDSGFLQLAGRKRNVFITSHGRNVSPEWIEAELAQTAAIAQAAVFGEAQARNVAVLVPRDLAAAACEQRAALAAAVAQANARLPDYARVSAWITAAEVFSAENGLATPNGRVRREAIEARYAPELRALWTPEPVQGETACPASIE